jgi:hypothetical protein
MSIATADEYTEIRSALGAPRVARYVAAAGGDTSRALELYGWNARISAALMLPAHFSEVAARNAVDEALTAVYGPRWPWSESLHRSLPDPKGRTYSARRDLEAVGGREETVGKVIAELKFVFWQTIFTARHDGRIWDRHIDAVLPNANTGAKVLRSQMYDDLDSIRQLRNRIAHHEPVFDRDLHGDLHRMLGLVGLRSRALSTWVREIESATSMLGERPWWLGGSAL